MRSKKGTLIRYTEEDGVVDVVIPDDVGSAIAPLLQIKDAYPKMLISRTRHDEYQHECIRVVDFSDWLIRTTKKIQYLTWEQE